MSTRKKTESTIPAKKLDAKVLVLRLGDIVKVKPELVYRVGATKDWTAKVIRVNDDQIELDKQCGNCGREWFAETSVFDVIKNESNVLDSEMMHTFSTGAIRKPQDGKGRYDLIPYHPLRRLAVHFENGGKEYGDNNWLKGIPLSRYYSAATRHLEKLKAGMVDEDHAAAALWNIVAAMETQRLVLKGELPAELIDTRVQE